MRLLRAGPVPQATAGHIKHQGRFPNQRVIARRSLTTGLRHHVVAATLPFAPPTGSIQKKRTHHQVVPSDHSL